MGTRGPWAPNQGIQPTGIQTDEAPWFSTQNLRDGHHRLFRRQETGKPLLRNYLDRDFSTMMRRYIQHSGFTDQMNRFGKTGTQPRPACLPRPITSHRPSVSFTTFLPHGTDVAQTRRWSRISSSWRAGSRQPEP